MGLENGTYINSLNSAWPIGATDPKSEGDNHFRLLKSTIKATLPNLTGAMTATQDELNTMDGITATTAELNVLNGITPTVTELNYVNGVTSAIQPQLDAKQASDAGLTDIAALAVTDSNFIVGNGSNWVAETGATARTSLGVDPIGTDNSTNVSIEVGLNYVTITGQVLTLNSVDLAADVTGVLPTANIANLAITGAKVANLTLSEGKFPTLAAGTTYRHHSSSGGTTTSGSAVIIQDPFVIQRAGTYRISFTVTNSDNVDNTASRIYKNASTGYSGFAALGTTRTVTNTTPITYTEDFALNAGDMIAIYTQSLGSGTNPTISNIFTSTTNKAYG